MTNFEMPVYGTFYTGPGGYFTAQRSFIGLFNGTASPFIREAIFTKLELN
jgi:hypothetical protein